MEVNADADDDNLPEFFKVYISHHSSHKMSIPGEFVDYLGGKKSGPAELAGPSGQTWRVELVEDEKGVYFSNGWQAFIDDNMVRDGDFLFFKFHGNLMFSVVFYDESMCEKRVAMTHVSDRSQRRGGIKEAEQEQIGIKPVKRSAGHPEADDSLFPSEVLIAERTSVSANPSFEKCIEISYLKGTSYLMLPSSFVQEHSLSYNSNEKMILQTGRNSSWEVCVINSCGAILLRKGMSVFARENNIRAGDVCKFELLDRLKMFVHVAHRQEGIRRKNVNVVAQKRSSLMKAVGVSQRRLSRGSAFIAEERKSAATTRPSFVNPVFVAYMKKYNVNWTSLVNIPSWFIRENSLQYKAKEKMVLRTATDSSWPVNLVQTKPSYCLSGGWAAFVRDNSIKEGDTCKFELVNRLEMMVQITRSSEQD